MANITIPQQQVGLPRRIGLTPESYEDATIEGQVLSAVGKQVADIGERALRVSREAEKNQALAELEMAWTDWELENTTDPTGYDELVENTEAWFKQQTKRIGEGFKDDVARRAFTAEALKYGIAQRNKMAMKAQTQRIETTLARTNETIGLYQGKLSRAETNAEFGAAVAAIRNQYEFAVSGGLMRPNDAQKALITSLAEATSENLEVMGREIYARAQAGEDVTESVTEYAQRAAVGYGGDEQATEAVDELLPRVEEATVLGIVARRIESNDNAVDAIERYARQCKGEHCAGVVSKLHTLLGQYASRELHDLQTMAQKIGYQSTLAEAELTRAYNDNDPQAIGEILDRNADQGTVPLSTVKQLRKEARGDSALYDDPGVLREYTVNLENYSVNDILAEKALTPDSKKSFIEQVRERTDEALSEGIFTIRGRFPRATGIFADPAQANLAAQAIERFRRLYRGMPEAERTMARVHQMVDEATMGARDQLTQEKIDQQRKLINEAREMMRSATMDERKRAELKGDIKFRLKQIETFEAERGR